MRALPMTWRWLSVLLLTVPWPMPAQTGEIYRCVDADGAVSYQDTACAATARQRRIEIAPPPPSVDAEMPPPSRARATRPTTTPARHVAVTTREASSFECRTATGLRFYRHGACPKSVVVADANASIGRRGTRASTHIAVSAHPVSRREACRAIHAPGVISRDGHQYDERSDAHTRNLGRDACHRQ